MIATRYAPAACLLCALALVPTLIHSYSGGGEADGRSAKSIPENLLGYVSSPSSRPENWGERRFDSTDWIEREYRSEADEVRLTVIRSLDLKALYHHPELEVAYGRRFGSSFDRYEVVRLPSAPHIPVHVLHPAPASNAVALYVLEYDGAYVEHPIWFQMRTAAELLFSRRKLMTLFFAHDLRVDADAAIEELPSTKLLFAAIETFADSSAPAGQ